MPRFNHNMILLKSEQKDKLEQMENLNNKWVRNIPENRFRFVRKENLVWLNIIL